jgi:hypothetical protein
MKKNLPEFLVQFSATFEYELLVRLMLLHWKHPMSGDVEYCKTLVEVTAELLLAASKGERHFEDLKPGDMNLVAAAWYVEAQAFETSDSESEVVQTGRKAWLDAVRHSLPSCFCDPGDLGY